MQRTPWIVVAHSTEANIYTVDSPTGPLRHVAGFEHPESALRNRELETDRPGRAFDSAGEGRHAMSSEVEPAKQEAIRFARRLADELRAGRVAHRYDELLLVAAPEFLGLLRDALDDDTRARVSFELDKNLAHEDAEEIRRRLPERL
ncbi:hypothetical protein BH24PSE2_BH24PSE2_20750 [soil metagenome]